MKNVILALAGVVVSITTMGTAHAQTPKNMMLLSGPSLETISPSTSASAADVNNRALRDFKKSFPKAEGEEWSQLKDGWLVTFKQDDVRRRVVYNSRGDWQFSIYYYGENRLPTDVRATVKSQYFDYSITGVEEVHVGDKVAYLVHMQDEKTWKLVRVCDDTMDVLEDFNKA